MNNSRRHFLSAAIGGLIAGPSLSHSSVSGQSQEHPGPAIEPLIMSSRHLGNQFLDNPVGVTGMDGATSTLLPSGESLWVFGDTVEGPFKSIHGLDLSQLRSNTAAVVPRQAASRGIQQFQFLATPDGKRPRQIVPFAADEDPAVHRIWAIHGVCLARRIYLFYHRITMLKGVDVFANFQLDGMGIARGEIGEYRFERLTAPDGTREFWKGDQPSFGVFVERAADYVYLWGCLQTGMHLARTRPDSLEDLASYEYLVEAPDSTRPTVEPRWARRFEPTAKLFDSVPNEMSAAYNPHLGRHVAIHSLHREHKIVMRTAPRITGPWSDGEIVFRPERIADGDLIYAAKEHPELAEDHGRVLYVTFVNSATYVPQLIELTLKP
jgi:hypothetical protein